MKFFATARVRALLRNAPFSNVKSYCDGIAPCSLKWVSLEQDWSQARLLIVTLDSELSRAADVALIGPCVHCGISGHGRVFQGEARPIVKFRVTFRKYHTIYRPNKDKLQKSNKFNCR